MPQKRNSPSLSQLREQIDRLDSQILRLLNRRARLATRIGHLKNQDRASVYVPSRERQIFARLAQLNQGPLPNEAVGKSSLDVSVNASRSFRASGDSREVSLMFGLFEIR